MTMLLPITDIANAKHIEGYITPYGVRTSSPVTITNSGRKVWEVVEAGAFADIVRTISKNKREIVFDLEHLSETDPAIGGQLRTSSDNINLSEDARGFKAQIALGKDKTSESLRTLIGSGKVTGLSVAMAIDPDDVTYSVTSEGDYVRHIHRVADVTSFALTSSPAYPSAVAYLRSQATAEEIESINKEVEQVEQKQEQQAKDAKPEYVTKDYFNEQLEQLKKSIAPKKGETQKESKDNKDSKSNPLAVYEYEAYLLGIDDK